MKFACKNCVHGIIVKWGYAKRYACNHILREPQSVLDSRGILRDNCNDREEGEGIVAEIAREEAEPLEPIKDEHGQGSYEYREAIRKLALEQEAVDG